MTREEFAKELVSNGTNYSDDFLVSEVGVEEPQGLSGKETERKILEYLNSITDSTLDALLHKYLG